MVTPLVVLRAMLVEAPLQIVCEAGAATTFGFGLTVITTTIGVPAQPAAEGVIVYVAVPADEVVAVNVWAIVAPRPAVAPLTLLCTTCLLYTSDAADERSSVDLGGRRIIKK